MMAEDSIPVSVIEGLISDYEGMLRAIHGGKPLRTEWEDTLAAIDRRTPTGKLKYWKTVAIYCALDYEERHGRRTADAIEASDAARKLLTREPIAVELSTGDSVHVTGRSFAALLQIAAHSQRIRMLTADLESVGDQFESAMRSRQRRSWAGRWRMRRRARRLADLYMRIATELLRHRERLYAHATTQSGAAAKSNEAPGWWIDLTPEDDALILVALHRAGVGRYAELGDPPDRGKNGGTATEDFGWAGLLASWGIKTKVESAALFDRDLGQVAAEMRVTTVSRVSDELSE